jgi:predicted 3-demethylubiquinone-9 3-methyltransferase (glyoxalase superfamily)
MQRITPFLTFEKDGKKAVEFYTSIFKNSSIDHAMTMPGSDQLLHAGFTLDGQDMMAMDGGDHFKFEDGTSLFVACADQEEVDYYWEKLTADGGEPGQCGWLKDKFGVSWQVIPERMGELMGDPDPVKAGRTMQAMLKMHKIDLAELEAAHDGK